MYWFGQGVNRINTDDGFGVSGCSAHECDIGAVDECVGSRVAAILCDGAGVDGIGVNGHCARNRGANVVDRSGCGWFVGSRGAFSGCGLCWDRCEIGRDGTCEYDTSEAQCHVTGVGVNGHGPCEHGIDGDGV